MNSVYLTNINIAHVVKMFDNLHPKFNWVSYILKTLFENKSRNFYLSFYAHTLNLLDL